MRTNEQYTSRKLHAWNKYYVHYTTTPTSHIKMKKKCSELPCTRNVKGEIACFPKLLSWKNKGNTGRVFLLFFVIVFALARWLDESVCVCSSIIIIGENPLNEFEIKVIQSINHKSNTYITPCFTFFCGFILLGLLMVTLGTWFNPLKHD